MNRMITMGMLVASSLAVACGSHYSSEEKNALPTTNAPPEHTGHTGPSAPPSAAPEESTDGAAIDAGADHDADASEPAVTCADQPTSGGFNFRCSAAAPSITPGGAIEAGSYVLSGYWANACSGFDYGTAEVFVENGKTYMRYVRIAKSDVSQPGTTYAGTWRLDATADGAITRTEVCGGVASNTGHFTQTGGTDDRLVFVFDDAAETWKKSP
jgi:hypothetical protein